MLLVNVLIPEVHTGPHFFDLPAKSGLYRLSTCISFAILFQVLVVLLVY